MSSPFSFVLSLKELFAGKLQHFMSDIDDVHSVWLNEIQQEANRMLTSDVSDEPVLMPKTPSQKRNNRKKRVSVGYQEEASTKRRFSKGKRSKLRGSSVKTLVLIAEDEDVPQATTSGQAVEQPKRSTRRNKQTPPEVSLEAAAISETPPEVSLEAAAISDCSAEQVPEEQPEVVDMEMETAVPNTEIIMLGTDEPQACVSNTPPSPPNQPPIPAPEVSVRMSSEDRRSAELVAELQASPGRNAAKIAIAGTPTRARRSSVRHSLKLRYSKAGLRHSMTQDAVCRASRRSMLKKKSTRGGNSTCSSNVSDDSCMEIDREVEKCRELPSVERVDEVEAVLEESQSPPETVEQKPVSSNERTTLSMAVNSPSVGSPVLTSRLRGATAVSSGTAKNASVGSQRRLSGKRKSPDIQDDSPTKKRSPPRKSKPAIRSHMRGFLQTAQKNPMVVMTPTSVGRSSVVKSFIKHTTPIKIDPKSRKVLQALKQKQEEEGIKKMEEEKRRKQEEVKRKRDERLRRVVESRMKEDEEKTKRLEQKMSQSDEKNDKMRVERIAEKKAKKKVAVKRQEELDQKRRVEEEARLQKIQQAEEERRQQELVAKRAAEEDERTRKMAEARRALELRRERELERERQRELERKKELERERQKELEREKQAAAERERAEREKALALQHEVERAAREKERRELEEKIRLEEEEQRLAAEKAAREREAAKQKMAAASVALNNVQSSVLETPMRTGAALNVTVEVESSVLKTPVGKGAALNVTMEVENSPQSYSITPKGGNKPLINSTNSDDYGMDQKSDDSTDDESAPRKPIPSWAEGHNFQQTIMKQYFNPPDLHTYFGAIEPPKLENIFYKSKPRYFKRTSSAVWHSPPRLGHY